MIVPTSRLVKTGSASILAKRTTFALQRKRARFFGTRPSVIQVSSNFKKIFRCCCCSCNEFTLANITRFVHVCVLFLFLVEDATCERDGTCFEGKCQYIERDINTFLLVGSMSGEGLLFLILLKGRYSTSNHDTHFKKLQRFFVWCA